MGKFVVASLTIILVCVGVYRISNPLSLLTTYAKQLDREILRVKAFNYLVNSYNSTLGLCYEHPSAKNVYWISNDNVLASFVLQKWNREIADNITETIKKLSSEYNLTTSSVGIPLNCRAEILLGYQVGFFFNETKKVTLNASYYGSTLKMEKANNTIDANFSDYADLLCYASLVEWRKGNYSGADDYYEMFKAKWDGNGFKDKAFNGSYATYKLGLFYFLNKILGKGSFWFERELIERVWQCQDNNGGFKTDYYANGSFPECQTNTETTSIILLSDIPYAVSSVMVGAYYYIWWGIPFNNHWKHGVKYTPFLGEYNSSDPLIADHHILWAKQHGIDFFSVSWLGKGDWIDLWDFDDTDQNLKSGLLKAQYLSTFKFCLFYESQIVIDSALNATINPDQNFTRIFIEDMNHAKREYFDNPSYLKIDGVPVLFIYNLPYIYDKLGNETQNLFRILKRQLDIYLVADVGNNPEPLAANSSLWSILESTNATTSYFFAHSKISEGWLNLTKYARTYYPEWRSIMNSKGIKYIPNAYAGYDNTEYCIWKNDSSTPPVLPLNKTMFEEMLKIACDNADNNLKMVMITSWNEWLESTSIEPSMEFGEDFLHVIPEFPTIFILPLSIVLTIIASTELCAKKRRRIKTQIY